MDKRLAEALPDLLALFADGLTETVNRRQLEGSEGLRRLVLIADDIAAHVGRDDLDWLKTRGARS